MHSKITLAVGMAAIFAAVLAFPSQAAFAATVNAEITPGAQSKTTDAFSPNPLQAHVGDTVIWTNKDTALHTVTSGSNGKPDGQFGSKPDGSPELLSPGKTQQFTPTKAGDVPYFCMLHPSMVGTLKVEAAGAGGSTGTTGTTTGNTTTGAGNTTTTTTSNATSQQTSSATATLKDKTYTVSASSSTSKVTSATIKAGQSVNIAFDKPGDVQLTLPKAMIDGIQNVTANGKQLAHQEVTSNSTSTTIKFTLPAGTSAVDISGATVVPEFGVIAALVLAASLVAAIGVARFRGLAFSGFKL